MEGMDEVLGDITIQIIERLDAKHTAILSCLNSNFKTWCSDPSIWSFHCSTDLNLSSPTDPLGHPVASFKVAYQIWRQAFSMYPWSLVKRVKSCWDRLKDWFRNNFPEVQASLREGVSEEELDAVEKDLNLKLPITTRLIYRFHDAQNKTTDFAGLIGGYYVYDHIVNVGLLPLEQIAYKTMDLSLGLNLSNTSKYMAVACSIFAPTKFFFLNCVNLQLYVAGINVEEEGQMMPCVPSSLLNSSGDKQCDGFLLWLEEHARRLESGMISVRYEDGLKLGLKALSLFPEKPPLCSTAVTNGVKVRASAILVPEQSDYQNNRYLFAYSIRMSLLPEGCTIYGMNFHCCQLHRRHWIIRENEIIKDDVSGEGVTGKYPLLFSVPKEFIYQSCVETHLPGSIEGSFTFVPGRLIQPRGDPFEVEVARFPLVMPDYIF